MKSEIQELELEIAAFCSEREWDRFHTNRNLAAALAVEAAELQDAYLWDREASPEKLNEELADILIYALRIAERNGIDIGKIISEKLQKNAAKYPVGKCRGTAKKYSEL